MNHQWIATPILRFNAVHSSWMPRAGVTWKGKCRANHSKKFEMLQQMWIQFKPVESRKLIFDLQGCCPWPFQFQLKVHTWGKHCNSHCSRHTRVSFSCFVYLQPKGCGYFYVFFAKTVNSQVAKIRWISVALISLWFHSSVVHGPIGIHCSCLARI